MANQNANQTQDDKIITPDFDELERELEAQLQEELFELEHIDKNISQFGKPEALGGIILDTVWEQFTNQIAVRAGEDFIKTNNKLRLDLRDDAHIQTTDNFASGNMASHNTEIDYQKRYDDWQSNFIKENGKVQKHTNRSKREVETLVPGARNDFDKNRPAGSKERHTHMDHTVSAGEIIRDPSANAHMTRKDQISFANSEANLNEIDSSWNQSKSDMAMDEWLDNKNANGQKPNEIFDMSVENEQQLREKGFKAKEEYEHQKKNAEKLTKESGIRSQRAEALRVGKKAARSILMNLLADLVRKIIQKLVAWLKLANKSLKSLLLTIKDAIVAFLHELKTHVINVVDSAITVIATSIIGPVISTLKKAWMFIKQGWSSLRDAITYIKSPENKGKPIGIMMLEVSKLITAGLSVAGAIILSEVIEKGLTTVPLFAIDIPMFGSMANIIGIFMGAVVSGILGALALNLINRLIEKKQKEVMMSDRIDKSNKVLATQDAIITIDGQKLVSTKINVVDSITKRHVEAAQIIHESLEIIIGNQCESNEKDFVEMKKRLDDLGNTGGLK